MSVGTARHLRDLNVGASCVVRWPLTLNDATPCLWSILVIHQAANSLRRVFPTWSPFIHYKAIEFKEITLITGWSPSSVSSPDL